MVRVVADQRGTPTYADDLAAALLDIARQVLARGDCAPFGTYHLVAQGETTWFGFAEEIFRTAALFGHKVPRLEAITTADYPTPAPRPAYSVLDTGKIKSQFGIALPPFKESLPRMVERSTQPAVK